MNLKQLLFSCMVFIAYSCGNPADDNAAAPPADSATTPAADTAALAEPVEPQPEPASNKEPAEQKQPVKPATRPAVTKPDGAHSSRNTLDWHGAYRGVLPCADCEGIETILTLATNNTFTLSTLYKGKEGKAQVSAGTFNWNDAGSVITLKGGAFDGTQYQVGENRLTQLDKGGQKVSGSLADKYVLKKGISPRPVLAENATELSGTYWKLTELRGRPVQEGWVKEPHLIFNAATGRLTGHTGCNIVNAGFETSGMNRIKIGRAAVTRMACRVPEQEQAFLKALEEVTDYTINEGVLQFSRSRMAPAMKFVAVKK
ncbi:MAG TPA: copper resistance protein NlpE N-terminal domain-containing protein [Lacibacter sp.]|nr:copper resistance protein NlpE N-terminal domain-containing protein [Lacibacter sp.]HMO90174.1 copper resistance protein NlpE N-terminal domain-containing protein [Lacibacter sp.]HMP86089.1 copper resistance protein NlpE N-terminal domain-containing protein [Lacibacter sp.]